MQFKKIPMTTSAHSMAEPPLPRGDKIYRSILKKIGFKWLRPRGMLFYVRRSSEADDILCTITAILAVAVIEKNEK